MKTTSLLLSILVLLFIGRGIQIRGQQSPIQKSGDPDWSLLLPEDEIKPLIQRRCGSCHVLKLVVTQRADSDAWERSIEKMSGEGLIINSDEERDAIIKYLAEHFGPKTPVIRFPLDMDTARAEQLTMLPGIAEKQAQEIIGEREKNGGHLSPEALGKILGSEAFGKIKDFITTGSAGSNSGTKPQ